MRIAKIKYNGSTVEIHSVAKRPNSTEETETKFRSPDAPRPEFVDAMASFVDVVIRLLRLPEEYANGLKVTGVSINEEEGDGREGVVITAMKTLPDANSPLVINTPHMREPVDMSKDIGAGFYIDGVGGRLDLIEGEARRFLAGERAQQELPLDASNEGEKTEDRGDGRDESTTISINGGPSMPFSEFERRSDELLAPIVEAAFRR